LSNVNTNTNKVVPRCDLSGIKTSRRLYNLSKSKQEDGRKRRKDIEKNSEPWKHPTGKISLASATRIYYDGLKLIDKRRIAGCMGHPDSNKRNNRALKSHNF